jgi:hypothetical protein
MICVSPAYYWSLLLIGRSEISCPLQCWDSLIQIIITSFLIFGAWFLSGIIYPKCGFMLIVECFNFRICWFFRAVKSCFELLLLINDYFQNLISVFLCFVRRCWRGKVMQKFRQVFHYCLSAWLPWSAWQSDTIFIHKA